MITLLDILNSYRENPPVNVPAKNSPGFYPSAASIEYIDPDTKLSIVKGECARKTFYSKMGYPIVSTTDARRSRIMDMGNYLSNMLVEDAKRAGIYIADELPFTDVPNNISGRIDLIVKDPFSCPKTLDRPSPEHLILIEIKSVGGYYNVKGCMTSTRDTPLRPKIEHLLQVMVYANYYRKYGVNKYVLLYINRENLEIVTHNISINDNGNPVITNDAGTETLTYITIDGVMNRYAKLSKYIADKELPPRDYSLQWSNQRILRELTAGTLSKTDTEIVNKKVQALGVITNEMAPLLQKGDWQCQYCEYATTCWSNDPTDRKVPSQSIEQTEPDVLSDFV